MYPLAQDFRAAARDRLSGNWGVSIAVCLVAFAIIGAASFTFVGSILLVGALELGMYMYFCQLMMGGKPEFVTLFNRFEIFFKACGLYLFIGLFVFLWGLLLWVPGIIAAYRYAMAPYLMAEYPEMGIQEAVNRSKQMMDGHKWRLFCLHMSFIGWAILSLFTAGLLLIWLMPYMQAAEAAFYLNITNRILQKPQPGGAPDSDYTTQSI